MRHFTKSLSATALATLAVSNNIHPTTAYDATHEQHPEDYDQETIDAAHHHYHGMLKNAKPFHFVNTMKDHPHNGTVDRANGKYPVVFMHGMGDAGHNHGMHEMCEDMAHSYGVYVVCLDVADGAFSIITRMEHQLKALHLALLAHPQLAGGFNAMGNSQGGLLMRAYINKINSPPVHRYVSNCGVQNGIAGLPKNIWWLLPVWKHILNPYKTPLVFSDYWKDPHSEEDYLAKSPFLADVNNEGKTKNPQYKENMTKLNMYVTVEALEDTMVYPHASENHGFYAWGSVYPVGIIQQLRDTQAYKEDWLGLKTLDTSGRMKHYTFHGNHLRVPSDLMYGVLFPILAGERAENNAAHGIYLAEGWEEGADMNQGQFMDYVKMFIPKFVREMQEKWQNDGCCCCGSGAFAMFNGVFAMLAFVLFVMFMLGVVDLEKFKKNALLEKDGRENGTNGDCENNVVEHNGVETAGGDYYKMED